jgi:hypothetical protein
MVRRITTLGASTMNLEADIIPPTAAQGLRPIALVHWLALAGVLLAAIAMRQIVAGNSDVSWLLIAGERWLDGQRLYSEILETNPPMAVLVYVPAILIARVIGLPAEIVVDSLVFAAIVVSIAATALILRRSTVVAVDQRWPLAIIGAAVLGILPVQTFGQREHIAVIELLPAIAVLSLRLNHETPAAWASWVAGIGLGLAMSFKPHFALAMVGCIGVAAVQLKSARILLVPENDIGVAIVTIYAVCTVVFFPEYFTDMVPLIRDVYSIGLSLLEMLKQTSVPLWCCALICTALLTRHKAMAPGQRLLMAASVWFGVIYLVQRKGWPYHSYPMLAFALLSFGYGLSARDPSLHAPRFHKAGWGIAFVLLFAASMIWFDHALDMRVLQRAVTRLGLQHPTILVVTGDAGVAHPLARAVGGIWASRQQSLLASSYDHFFRRSGSSDQRALSVLDGYVQRERAWLIEDFQHYQPKIVLIDNMTDNWEGWLRQSPEFDHLIKDYRLSDTVENVDIYVRRPN